MTLFTNDLYRNFGIGFLIGGIMVAVTNPDMLGAIAHLVA